MRFVIALVRHETNSFSPNPTPLSSFNRGGGSSGPLYGNDAIQACQGTNSAAAAFIDLARAQGHEFVMPLMAYAMPSGLVTSAAFEHIATTIVESVRQGCDAVLLDLHGAMISDHYSDAEGELLKRIRTVAPDVPIAVALDFHANFSSVLIENATVVTGYRTYPHIDIYETGERAARTLMAALRGEVTPAMIWRSLPMLTHTLRQTPLAQPMKDIMDRARQAESDGEILNASVFGGFPYGDTAHAGLTVVVVADTNHLNAAQRVLDELCSEAWARRADFRFHAEPMEKSIARALSAKAGPIVMADHGDNCGAGGSTDDMTVLREVLHQGLQDVVAGPFWDPAAVAAMVDAGVGSSITVDVGGKTDVPALGISGQPLRLTGRVRCITDGQHRVFGPMHTGMLVTLGRTAVLDTGSALVVISEKPQEPFDTGVFTHAGIDPARHKYVLIKSRQHFRASFEPIAKEVILVAGPGVASADLEQFPFNNLRRPIYPFDPEMTI